jgi:ABC-2 type transport system permease protein
MMVSLILGMIIFIFIETFTGSVMSSVIEEKSSRVIEVLISSVKSTELLFGKIIGVALVALTQFAMWILLTGIIVVVAGGIIGVDNMSAVASDPTMQQAAGMDMTGLTAGMAAQADTTSVAPDEMTAVVTTLQSMNWGEIIVCFFIYFILGYLLYASLMAAVGSASENADDSQQLVLPITIPLIIGFFMAIYTFNAPDSGIAFWGSMIPFTSPLVMLARIPYGVPFWELALSVVLLLLTFILCGWIGAKIYRAGILMFGKKTTFKDLWKWLRQS